MVKVAIILLALLTSACAGSTMAPSVTPAPPVVLSGQSNAQFVEPFLRATYTGSVRVSAASGMPISAWDWTDLGSSGASWRALEPLLTADLRAFVWWQGESDANNPQYAEELRALMDHIRAVAGRQLPLVIVQVENTPELQNVRAIQAAYVANDPNARLVSTDGAPLRPGEVHLTDEGYRMVADRIVAALR